MRIIAIINQKGGCGKTTSAINLAGILAKKGLRTLLVDMDPQSHCAAGLAIPEQRIDLDIGDAMLLAPDEPLDPKRLLWRATRNLDLAPSRMKLAGLEAPRGGLADLADKEHRLAALLARFQSNYDACLIDCSPSIGLLTFNALAAATEILIPVETSFFALQGATKQVNTIRTLSKRLGTQAPYWVFATLHDESSVLARDLLQELRTRFAKRIAPEVIRRDPTLKEAASFGQPVIEYSPEAAGSRDYTALAEWLIGAVGLTPDGQARAPEPSRPATDDTVHEVAAALDPPTVEIVGGVEAKLPRRAPSSESPQDEPRPLAAAPTIIGPDPAANIDPDAAPPNLSRAEDLAQRARLLLLKRADDQLRQFTAEARPAATPEPPTEAAPFLGEPKSLAREQARVGAVRALYGVRHTRSGTLFVQPLSLGDRVAIAGDFNGWAACPMKRNDQLGVYELCLHIPAGRRRYRLVVDGRWITDPFNDLSEPNPFGELNSIIDAAAAPPAAAPAPTAAAH